MPSCTSVVFVTGSLCMTGALIAVGISFFSPYWLSNIPSVNESNFTSPLNTPYLNDNNLEDYPDRGLWAQCGATCQWFWENQYQLQIRLLTPLKDDGNVDANQASSTSEEDSSMEADLEVSDEEQSDFGNHLPGTSHDEFDRIKKGPPTKDPKVWFDLTKKPNKRKRRDDSDEDYEEPKKEWHLACQVLYFIGTVVLLTCEIYARVQLCCDERTSVYWSLAALILTSALIQTAAIATFGGGAARDPYWAISDPMQTTPLLGQPEQWLLPNGSKPYLGWAFWMAVTGDILTVVAGAMFIITACCCARYTRKY